MSIGDHFTLGLSRTYNFNDPNNPMTHFTNLMKEKGGLFGLIDDRVGRIAERDKWVIVNIDQRDETVRKKMLDIMNRN